MLLCLSLSFMAFEWPESYNTISQDDPWVLLYESSDVKLSYTLEKCADSLTYMSYKFVNNSPMPLTVGGVIEVSDSLTTENVVFEGIMLDMNAETLIDCNNSVAPLNRLIEMDPADNLGQFYLMVNVKALNYN